MNLPSRLTGASPHLLAAVLIGCLAVAAPTLRAAAQAPAPAAEPAAAEPAAAEPTTTQPAAAKPTTTQPAATTKPVTVAPTATKPVTVAPTATKPVTVAPTATKPVTVAPDAAKPAAVAPEVPEPATVPGGSEPPTAVRPAPVRPPPIQGTRTDPEGAKAPQAEGPARGPAPAGAPAGKSFVLPPAAGGALKNVLNTTTEALGGRLVFQKAALDRAQAVVTYGASMEGDGTLVVTLIHPSTAEGREVVKAGPFAILREPGPIDDTALAALVARLEKLNPSVYWVEVGEEPEAEPAKAPPEPDTTIVDETRRRIRAALAAGAGGDGPAASKLLLEMGRDEASREAAGLDLAEAWHGVADARQAAAAVEMWQTDLGGAKMDPVDKWRAAALTQKTIAPEKLLGDLKEAERLCEVDVIARSMAAAGAGDQALSLLEIVAADRKCPTVKAEVIEMMLAKGDVAAAERLSAALVEEFPEDETARGIRARLLLASDDPKEAAAVLEPVVWRDPGSGLIGAYLGAVHRVPDAEWQQERLDEHLAQVEANPDDHVAAFLAGVQLHYTGDYEGSERYLELAAPTFKDQPRLYIYRAMNAFNRGDAAAAMKLLDQAEELPNADPDTHYCRAEILRWSHPQQALTELRRYLAQTAGSLTANPHKQERVGRMSELLAECIADGSAIPCVAPFEHPRGHWANREPTELDLLMPWLGELCIALGVLILLLVRVSARRSARRREEPAA